jgi:hypothetical protein
MRWSQGIEGFAMTQIEEELHKELAIARLRFDVNPDQVEQKSELEKAQHRYSRFLLAGEIPSDLQERKTMAQTA